MSRSNARARDAAAKRTPACASTDDGDTAARAREASTSDTAPRGAASAVAANVGHAFEYKIALGSSGWLFVYYIGVVKAMRERGLHEYVRVVCARAAWRGVMCALGAFERGRARGARD